MNMKDQRSPFHRPNRRQFLGQSACAALGNLSILNTLLNLKLAGSAAAQSGPTDYRTLVCVFLHGGNDSFNWLVPRDAARHAVYTTTRDNLALPLNTLRPLNQSGGDGQEYGLHPNCPGLEEMFNGLGGDTAKRRAAWISNVGTLIAPVTKAQYLAETMPLPRALFSHSDQIDQWQTSVPQGMTQLSGWAGRAADVLHASSNTTNFSMNLSLAGNNLLQVGNQTSQFVVTDQGALTFTGSYIGDPSHFHRIKNAAHRSILAQQYANLVQQSFSGLTRSSIELQEFFLEQFSSYDDSAVAALFPNSYMGSQFRAAAKMIGLRQALGLHRQTLFIGFGGWDHHTELLDSQAPMLSVLDAGLAGFQRALDAMGLQDSVLTFTSSDFSRTLRSNGRGTDHAWGANALVMGGPVQGGRIYGTFPDLAIDSNNDTGYGGRMIPTTSVDQFVGEMLRWFGVAASDMPYVLPNLGNFYNASSSTLPIGFLKPGTWS